MQNIPCTCLVSVSKLKNEGPTDKRESEFRNLRKHKTSLIITVWTNKPKTGDVAKYARTDLNYCFDSEPHNESTEESPHKKEKKRKAIRTNAWLTRGAQKEAGAGGLLQTTQHPAVGGCSTRIAWLELFFFAFGGSLVFAEWEGFRCILWLTRKQWEPRDFLFSFLRGVISIIFLSKRKNYLLSSYIFHVWIYIFFSVRKENDIYIISWLIKLLKTLLLVK